MQTAPPQAAAVLPLPERRTPLGALVVSLRPRQWSKNLLLFAGIIFAIVVLDSL